MDTSNNLENNVSPASQDSRSTQQDFEYMNLLTGAQPADGADLPRSWSAALSTSEASVHEGEGAANSPYVRQHRHHKTVEPMRLYNAGRKLELPEVALWLQVQQGFLREERLAQAKERCAPSQGRSLQPVLQVPKGQRDIFVRKSAHQMRSSLIAAIIVWLSSRRGSLFPLVWMSANWERCCPLNFAGDNLPTRSKAMPAVTRLISARICLTFA